MIGSIFSLKQLETLIWVADLGSFRRAAEHLNTTQPNISSRISGFEATLGVVLMHRDAGSVRLTDKGREILDHARLVLRSAEALVDAASRNDLLRDRLRLGVTELVACTWLHDYLRRLRQGYPGLAVELTVDLSRNLDAELRANRLDLTIQTAPFSIPMSGEVHIGTYPYVWAAAPELVPEGRGPLGLEEIAPMNILTHARHTQAFAELSRHAEALSIPQGRIVPSSSMASCVPMARDGMGVALLPAALVHEAVQGGSLAALQVDWVPAPLEFFARYRAEQAARHVAHAAEMAADVAAEHKKTL